jgi:hypothetical protein
VDLGTVHRVLIELGLCFIELDSDLSSKKYLYRVRNPRISSKPSVYRVSVEDSSCGK